MSLSAPLYRAVAAYPYTAKSASELTVAKGDTLAVCAASLSCFFPSSLFPVTPPPVHTHTGPARVRPVALRAEGQRRARRRPEQLHEAPARHARRDTRPGRIRHHATRRTRNNGPSTSRSSSSSSNRSSTGGPCALPRPRHARLRGTGGRRPRVPPRRRARGAPRRRPRRLVARGARRPRRPRAARVPRAPPAPRHALRVRLCGRRPCTRHHCDNDQHCHGKCGSSCDSCTCDSCTCDDSFYCCRA